MLSPSHFVHEKQITGSYSACTLGEEITQSRMSNLRDSCYQLPTTPVRPPQLALTSPTSNAWSPHMLHFVPFHTLSFIHFTSCAALPIKCSVSSYSLCSCPFIYVGIWIFLNNTSVCLNHKTVVKMWPSHWSFPYRPQKSVFLLLRLVAFGLQ